MAAITWYMTNSLAGTAHQEMSETDPGTEATTSPQTGWVAGNATGNHASMDAQTSVPMASFTATTQPDGTPVTTAGAGDCLRSTNTYNGSFASANWTFSFCFRGITQTGAVDGRVRFRLLRGANADGSGATDISGSQQSASIVTNLAATTQTSSLVVNPGAITVTNEYIFVQIAWERTGAGGMTTSDVAFRIGNSAGAGTRVVSSDFTSAAPTDYPQSVTADVSAGVTALKAATKEVEASATAAATVSETLSWQKLISAAVDALASVTPTAVPVVYEALSGVYGSIMGAPILGASIQGAMSYVSAANFPQAVSAAVDLLVTARKDVGKRIGPLVSAAVTAIKAVGKDVADALVSAGATVTKAVGKLVTPLASAAVTVTKNVGKIVTALVSLAVFVDTFFAIGKTVTALVSAGVTVQKAVGFRVTALVSAAVSVTKAVVKLLTAALVSVATTVRKNVGKLVSALVSLAVTITDFFSFGKLVTANVTAGVTITRAVGKLVTAALVGATVTVTKAVGKTVTAALVGLTVATRKAVDFSIDVLAGLTVGVRKNVGKLLSALVSLAVTIVTGAAAQKTVSALVSLTVTRQHAISKLVGPLVSAATTVRKAVGKLVTAALVSLTVTVRRAVAFRVTSLVSAAATVIKSVGKRLSAGVTLLTTVAPSILATIVQTVTALVSATVTVQKGVGKKVSALVSVLGSLATQLGNLFAVTVTAYVTAAVERVQRFACYLEGADSSVEQAEQTDIFTEMLEAAAWFVETEFVWDATRKGNRITLSDSNRNAAAVGAGSGYDNVFSNVAYDDLRLARITIIETFNIGLGVANAAASSAGQGATEEWIGFDLNSVAFYAFGTAPIDIWYGGVFVESIDLQSWADGDVVEIAFDGAEKRLWIRVNSSEWNGDHAANPTSPETGIDISFITGDLYLAAALFPGSNEQITLGEYDPWSTVDEQVDASEEQQTEPAVGCCDED